MLAEAKPRQPSIFLCSTQPPMQFVFRFHAVPFWFKKHVMFVCFGNSQATVILRLKLAMCRKPLAVKHRVKSRWCSWACLVTLHVWILPLHPASELEIEENHWWCVRTYIWPSTPGTRFTGSMKRYEEVITEGKSKERRDLSFPMSCAVSNPSFCTEDSKLEGLASFCGHSHHQPQGLAGKQPKAVVLCRSGNRSKHSSWKSKSCWTLNTDKRRFFKKCQGKAFTQNSIRTNIPLVE